MAATLEATDYVQVGQAVVFNGAGFAATSEVTISWDYEDIIAQVISNDAGEFSSTDLGNQAKGTLTLTGNAVAAETVVIGAKTYTWRASVSTTANEVKVGVDAATSLQNLMNAVNGGPGSGTTYGSATVASTEVTATADATHLFVTAIAPGTAGNSLASTETMTNGSWGGGTLSGGTASSGNKSFQWIPNRPGTFNITATDGTNTATCQVRVWSS